jgi:alpha-N-arabinofuranosidase
MREMQMYFLPPPIHLCQITVTMLFQGFLYLSMVAGIASAINLTVSSTGGNVTSPLMYGLMFEDINNSGDGGIYAELIQNRAFQGSTEYPSTLSPWSAVGSATLTLQNTTLPLSKALPASVNVAAPSKSTSGKIGLTNPGWWGISVKPQKYTGSFWVLGSYEGTFTVKLQSDLTNQVFVSLDIPSESQAGKWVEHTYELTPRLRLQIVTTLSFWSLILAPNL